MSLVISGNSSPVDNLVSFIFGFGKDDNSVDCIPFSKLSLETKYYSAEVSVHKARVSSIGVSKEVENKSDAQNTSKYDSDLCKKVENADTFIFTMCAEEATGLTSKTGESTDSGTQDVHHFCTIAEESDVPVRILNIVGKGPMEEERSMHWIGWGLDHGFEFIYIDSTNLLATAEEREKEGLPRLMESLHSHQWSSMVPKGSSSSQGSRSGPDVFQFHNGQAISEEERNEDTHKEEKEKKREKEREENEAKRLVQDSQMEAGGNPFLDEAIPTPTDDDAKDDGLEQLMAQARQLRELVDAGGLSDTARREKAAAFAMQFAAMVDISSGEDEESD